MKERLDLVSYTLDRIGYLVDTALDAIYNAVDDVSTPKNACEARFLMKLTAALKPFSIVVLIAVIFWDTADFTFSQIFETVVLIAFITVVMVFLMLFQMLLTVEEIAFRTLADKAADSVPYRRNHCLNCIQHSRNVGADTVPNT